MKFLALLLTLARMAVACSSDSSQTASVPEDAEALADDVEEAVDLEETETSSSEPPATPAPAPDSTTTAPVDSDTEPDSPAEEPTLTVTYGPIPLEPDCAAVGRVAVGVGTGTLASGGSEYTYQWTVPSSYSGDPIPVVLDFHGLGSSGAQQALFSGWSAKAEQEGFLSVQPTGLSLAGQGPSWELPQFDTPQRDDVAMVIDLLELVSANVCIDPARIYATGMSNGGFFTAELVCDLSERIAAAVSVAGVTHDESCQPTRAVPYLAFHGIDDAVVPFAGGESTLGADLFESGFFEQVMPDEFAEFANSFGCTQPADLSITAEVTLTEWTGCDDEIEVGFYAIAGAGHTWPGSALSAISPSLGVTNTDIDATQLSWDFFPRHSLGSE